MLMKKAKKSPTRSLNRRKDEYTVDDQHNSLPRRSSRGLKARRYSSPSDLRIEKDELPIRFPRADFRPFTCRLGNSLWMFQ
ncbi:hypothetical protein V6N13_120922 [Hibiscus sabdariffa]